MWDITIEYVCKRGRLLWGEPHPEVISRRGRPVYTAIAWQRGRSRGHEGDGGETLRHGAHIAAGRPRALACSHTASRLYSSQLIAIPT